MTKSLCNNYLLRWRTFCQQALILCLPARAVAQDRLDTISLHFRSGVHQLHEAHREEIDEAYYEGAMGDSIHIIGYTESQGGQSLAMSRARSVREWLFASGVDTGRVIGTTVIRFPSRRAAEAPGGRVDIVMKRAELPRSPATLFLDSIPDMQQGESIVLQNVLFFGGADEFLPVSYPILKSLTAVLMKYPDIRIQLEGHVCCGQMYNAAELSVDRAKAVYSYLIAHGIAAERLSFAGFAFSRPLIRPERNDTDRMRNRRVEARILNRLGK